MNARIIAISLLASLLCACSTANHQGPPKYTLDSSTQSLAEASYAVSRSMADLAETAQAAHPMPHLAPPPDPASYDMGGKTSVDWSGPIGPLVKQIADAAEYSFHELGTPPAIPVLVTVSQRHVALGDVLRDAGYQAGKRASVYVYPDRRLIELRYAKS